MPVSPVKIFTVLSLVISGLELVSQASGASPPQQGVGPYLAPYLKPGEIPDGVTIPLFHEVWTIMGSGLTTPNFTAQVDIVATQIFSEHFPTRATGSSVGVAAPTLLDGHAGNASRVSCSGQMYAPNPLAAVDWDVKAVVALLLVQC